MVKQMIAFVLFGMVIAAGLVNLIGVRLRNDLIDYYIGPSYTTFSTFWGVNLVLLLVMLVAWRLYRQGQQDMELEF